MLRESLARFLDRIWEATLKSSDGFLVHLGDSDPQKGALCAVVHPGPLWRNQSIRQKLVALLRHSWSPAPEDMRVAAEKTFLQDVFGEDEDFGPDLLKIMTWHGYRTWNLSSSNADDTRKAEALAAHAIAARMHFTQILSSVPPLNLRLTQRCPQLCPLAYAMAVKVPMITMRYFIEIHAAYTFNEIRAAGLPQADEIISYLYDVLFLQQKTAVAILEYLKLAERTKNEKQTATLTHTELHGIMYADLLVSYLKSSVEKTLALVAATHSIPSLDSKKTHKAKLDALDRLLPLPAKTTFYGDFLLEMVQSENFTALNNYRSGLLHKRGISDLQPHSYVGVPAASLPSGRVFELLHEHHSRNSAALLAALAMLTDELVRRAPPANAAVVRAELQLLALEKVPFRESAVHGMGDRRAPQT